jgi:proteasome lid subunit RPN8/RPN11
MDYHSEAFLAHGNTKPIAKSFRHLLGDSKNESCGIFVYKNNKLEYDFIPLENKNSYWEDQFTINGEILYKYLLSKDIIALCHSHNVDDPTLSEIDLEISEALGVPSFVISTSSKKSYLYYPQSYKPPPLKGRIFIPMFQDCMTYVKDYYEMELNIKLSKDIKNWARDRSDTNKNLMSEINNNFKLINNKNIKKGDIFIFDKNPSGLFHLGVVGSDLTLHHHPINCFPFNQFIDTKSADKVYKVYRYKDL